MALGILKFYCTGRFVFEKTVEDCFAEYEYEYEHEHEGKWVSIWLDIRMILSAFIFAVTRSIARHDGGLGSRNPAPRRHPLRRQFRDLSIPILEDADR